MEVLASVTQKAGHNGSDLVQLVERHQAPVWRYLRLLGADAEEADDLMQETFLRVARCFARGETVQSPSAFLRATARNLLISARRSRRSVPPTVEWTEAVDGLVTHDPTFLADDRVDVLRDCVERLTGRVHRVVQLHYIEGFSYQETAERTGLGVHSIKTMLRKARQLLRHCVERTLRGFET